MGRNMTWTQADISTLTAAEMKYRREKCEQKDNTTTKYGGT
jgi:hypothetical protein